MQELFTIHDDEKKNVLSQVKNSKIKKLEHRIYESLLSVE